MLSGIRSLYLDTNILIYWIESSLTTNERINIAFKHIFANDIKLFTSEITVCECMIGAIRKDENGLEKAYQSLLENRDFISLLPVKLDLLINTARLGAKHRLKTLDALHLATAYFSGCHGLLTNDKAFKDLGDLKIFQLSDFLS